MSDSDRNFPIQHVTDTLPTSYRYLVRLNQSYDGNPLDDWERVYPEDNRFAGSKIGPLTASDVVDLLWRDGRVPEWIDVAVVHADREFTYIELRCCGRVTAGNSKLYYENYGTGPFSIKSPPLPPEWEDKVCFALPLVEATPKSRAVKSIRTWLFILFGVLITLYDAIVAVAALTAHN